MKFYHYEREGGGAENVLAMLKGGHNKFLVVFTQWHEVLSIVKGGVNSFHPLNGRARKVLPCLDGGGGAQQVLDMQFSLFVAPPFHPLPVN